MDEVLMDTRTLHDRHDRRFAPESLTPFVFPTLLEGCLIWLLAGCQVSAMSVVFIAVTAGLKAEHLEQRPLMERVYCPPEGATCQVMRVYPDGGLYFQDLRDPTSPSWSYLTQVKPEGINTLQQTFDGLCRIKAEPPRNANDQGSLTWRWETSKCSREVLITGVSYGEYAALEGLTGVVNRNLVPRSP